MNKTWFKNILRMIQDTKGRFFSLMAIVAIGVAFFVGVAGTSPIMGYSVDAYDDQENLKDFTLYSNVGFDNDDLKALKDVKGIKTVEGSYFADVLACSGNNTYVTRIHSYNEKQSVNRVVLKKGRMPKNEHEALAENGSELERGFKLGSTVTFTNEQMKVDSVKIVGLVDTPVYLNQTKENSTLSNQSIRTYLYVPESSFSSSVYTEANILTKSGQSYYCFSDSYKDYIQTIKKRIKTCAKHQQAKRTNQLKAEAEKKIEELEQAQKLYQSQGIDLSQEITEVKEQVASIPNGKWTILDRDSHYASSTYKATVEQMKAIGEVFPVFFILVAALVCMTTMKRMVDEQRSEIGTLRALGYTQRQCCAKYLTYAAIATLFGEAIGSIVGLLTFPNIIYETWKMMYILPERVHMIPWNLIGLSCVAFLLGMLLTTYFSCRQDMKEVPSQLMRPKAPKLGKSTLIEKVPFLWNRFNFNTKVTIRNILRYKRRFLLTVIGVAGCSALLVTGFGIRDSIKDIVQLHFYEILKYDGYAQIESSASTEDINSLLSKIRDSSSVKSAQEIHMYTGLVKYGKEQESVNIQVFKNKKQASSCIDLRTRKEGEQLSLKDDGIIISEKLSENLGVKVGDCLSVKAEDGTIKKIPITGINEMYIQHYVFMTQACYEKYFGLQPESKVILIDVKGSQKKNETFQKELVDYPNVKGITFYDVTLQNFDNMISGLDVIVWALIISSMLLAFVVLSNLIQVNISERQREIATLKVLGFRKKEVRSYIFKENNVLVFLGAICGIPIGCALHHYIMGMVEMDYVMFGRSISWISFLYAICLTILFGLIVELFMRKRLHSIQMVDSLKSVE